MEGVGLLSGISVIVPLDVVHDCSEIDGGAGRVIGPPHRPPSSVVVHLERPLGVYGTRALGRESLRRRAQGADLLRQPSNFVGSLRIMARFLASWWVAWLHAKSGGR